MTDDKKKIVLSRGIFLSFLWGMGLKHEVLECTDTDIKYEGIAKRLGIWRRTRIITTAKLCDVRGISDMYSSYPIFWILTVISAMSALANVAKLNWWWSLQIWKVPFLWVGPSIIREFDVNWLYVHCILICIWGFLALLIQRRMVLVDAGPISTIKFNTRGLTSANIEHFKKEFYTKWTKNKPSASQ